MNTHVIFESVTDMDKNLDVLATVKADCMYKKLFKSCSIDCYDCKIYHKFNDCYSALATCDQLKVDKIAEQYVRQSINLRKNWKINLLKDKALIGFLIILFSFLFFIGITSAHAEPLPVEAMVTSTLVKTKASVHDCNLDRKLNCIDYTLQFKVEWDKVYSCTNCEIVRNYNRVTGFNHLFVRCRSDCMADWIYVEPQGSVHNYNMYSFWGDKYVCFWNKYGETELWLKRYK